MLWNTMQQKTRMVSGLHGVSGFSWDFLKRLDGAGTRIRTGDLLITNQLLYQLSYAGEGRGF